MFRALTLVAASLFIGACQPTEAEALGRCCRPVVSVPAVQVVHVQPRTVWTTRCRPILGGCVMYPWTYWEPVVPVAPSAPAQPTPAEGQ